jgi:hypothetical protein
MLFKLYVENARMHTLYGNRRINIDASFSNDWTRLHSIKLTMTLQLNLTEITVFNCSKC